VWWFNREGVETYYEDGERRRRFWENPRSEWIAGWCYVDEVLV
jgi:hypothetical protein